MSDTSSFAYDDGGGSGVPQNPPQPGAPLQGPYKFSSEELRVLTDCNRESFFERSLPLGTVMGLGAYFGIQKGHLKANPRFGVLPKVTLAVVMGYFIGKISYQEKCAEKLMALPGSYIGQLLRERKDGKMRGTSMHQPAPSMFGAGPNDIYSDAGPGSSLNLDTDRPIFSDDTYNPDSEGSPNGPKPEIPTRPMLSYDDLRRQNRGEYDAKQEPYKVDPHMAPPIQRPQTSPSPKPTNKYGDSME